MKSFFPICSAPMLFLSMTGGLFAQAPDLKDSLINFGIPKYNTRSTGVQPTGAGDYRNNPWDMIVFEGRIYVGAGNSNNFGPGQFPGGCSIVSFRPDGQGGYRYEGHAPADPTATVPRIYPSNQTDQIDRFRVINGQLVVPFHDPGGFTTPTLPLPSNKEINYITRTADNVWVLSRFNPPRDPVFNPPTDVDADVGIHVYDARSFGSRIFYGGYFGVRSDDQGLSGVLVTASLTRITEIMAVNGKLFLADTLQEYRLATGQINYATYFSQEYNPTTGAMTRRADLTPAAIFNGGSVLSLPPGQETSRTYKAVRSVNVGNKTLYLGGLNHIDHQTQTMDVFAATSWDTDNIQVQNITPAGGHTPWDLLEEGGRVFLLTSTKQGSGTTERFTIHIFELNAALTQFNEVVRCSDQPTFARSFARIAGDFFLGYGSDTGPFTDFVPSPIEGIVSYTFDIKKQVGTILKLPGALAPMLGVSPATGLAASGNLGGPFTPASAAYTLTNSGNSALDWTATTSAPWLTLSPAGGRLDPGANATVTATISAATIEPGGYSAAIAFVNTFNGIGNTTRAVALTVVLPATSMNAEPPFTGGTSNTVAWSAVSGATAYDVQRARAADFSDAIADGPLAVTSDTFSGLSDGALYRYRARARRSAPAAWVQTTQADFDSDVRSNVASTAAGEAILATSGATAPAGTNASFEDTAFTGWTKSFSNSVMGVQPTNLTDFPSMPTAGTYYAGFFTFQNSAQTAGSYARITQNVDLTGAKSLLFDAALSKRVGATWSNSVRAELRVDGTTLWSATGEGAYLNQAVDVSALTGTHIVELREEVIVAGSFNAQWVLFDNLRLSGASYVASGALTSTAIAPASWLQWGALTFTRDISGAGTALGVDVLAPDDTLLAANVGSGTNLNGIPAVASRSAIKLRANLSTSNSALTPRLTDWTVSYITSSAADALSAWSAAVASTQDASAPTVIVASAATAYGPAYRLSGMAADVSGVSALTVNGMSAASGDGFAHWSVPATLAPGSNSFTIVAFDGVANTRTLTFNVNRDSVDTNANGLPDAWEALYGGPGADPNRNGRINLLEFALGLDPVGADIGALPPPVLVPDLGDGHVYLTWSYRRRTDWSGLTYIPEVSTVLATWENGAGRVQSVGTPAPNPDGVTETVTVRALPPADTTGAPRFIRLRVTAP